MKSQAVSVAVLLLLLALTAVALILKAIGFFAKFSRTTRRIAEKIERAEDGAEYLRLRKELYCHYLCLIPFVNDRNVGRIYNRLFRKSKSRELRPRKDALGHLLAPSFVGLAVCAVCLCGATFAWFTSTQTSSVANIQTATYTVSVTAKKGDTEITVKEKSGYFKITLEAESEYIITLIADGNAKSGYCKTEFEETERYTPQITPDNVFTFKVKANNDGDLIITPQWGTCTATDNIITSETPLELGAGSVQQ